MDRSRWLWMSLALIPCAASVVHWCSPSAPAAVTARPLRSPLAFGQYSLSLKEIRAVSTVRGHFSFQNLSDQPVKITKIKPSCGCVSCNLSGKKLTYGPGDVGRIDLVLPTANEEPGQHQYTITVAYHDGEDRTTDLTFNVDLPAKSVRLEPSELYFYQYGEPLSREVKVIDDRNQILDIVDARIEYFMGEGRASEITPVEVAEAIIEPSEIVDGRRATSIRVNVSGELAPKERISHLVITTNDPEFPMLKVPMLIQPRKAPTASAASSSVPPVPGIY